MKEAPQKLTTLSKGCLLYYLFWFCQRENMSLEDTVSVAAFWSRMLSISWCLHGNVLPLVFSTAALLAILCHCCPLLAQFTNPQGWRFQALSYIRKHRLLPQIHPILGICQRVTAAGSAPQVGCLSCTWRLWELLSCSLQGNQSSQDQKSQPKSCQHPERYYLLLFALFCLLFPLPWKLLWRKIPGEGHC